MNLDEREVLLQKLADANAKKHAIEVELEEARKKLRLVSRTNRIHEKRLHTRWSPFFMDTLGLEPKTSRM